MDSTATMTNSDFLAEVLGELEPDEYGWVCSFRASPEHGEWGGRAYRNTPAQAATIDRATEDNTYFSTAVLAGFNDSAQWARQKSTFKRLAVLVLDDTSPESLVGGYSWAIQTSPGKWQVGILLDRDDPDCADLQLVDAAMGALSARGKLGGNDSSGNAAVRYVRLPVGCNTKPRAAGVWRHHLEAWHPQVRWTLSDACHAVGLNLDALRGQVPRTRATGSSGEPGQGSVAGEALAMLSASLDQRSYHDSLTKLAASLVAGGMYPANAVNFLYGLMDQVRPTGPAEEVARWQARRAEIPRAVKSAEKYAPADRVGTQVTVNLGRQLETTEPSELLLTLQQLGQKASAVKWQVKAAIPDDSLGMVFGASGTYKSFIALDHSLHVAHGLDWMGRKTKQAPVVYVAAEGGAGIYRRVQAWHNEFGLVMADNFHVCISPIVLSIEEHVANLASAIEKLNRKPGLIYIDTLSQTFEGDENSATDVSSYLRLINAYIRARFNCTVIVIHHSGHQATERPRGSSAITANVDFMLGVYRPDANAPIARVDVIKQKDGDKLQSQTFELKRMVLGQDDDGDELSSLVAIWKDFAGKVLENHRARMSAGEQTLLAVLEGPGAMQDHDLRHEFYNRLGRELAAEGKPYKQDTAKKTYSRALQTLSDRGLLVVGATGLVTMMRDSTGT